MYKKCRIYLYTRLKNIWKFNLYSKLIAQLAKI